MFTGIVQKQAKILKIAHSDHNKEIVFSKPVRWNLRKGESVLINGICSTVTSLGKKQFTVVYMPETLERTTVDTIRTGDTAHLEKSLRASDKIEGHILTGHIDAVGKVTNQKKLSKGFDLRVQLPKKNLSLIAPKGSIAVDGVSLTVISKGVNWFTTSLIPYTARHTHLATLKKGDTVNIELDIVAKYVQQLLQA